MSQFVTQMHRTKYRDSVKLSLQQKDSRLLKTVTTVPGSGELMKLDDLIGEADYYEKTSRHADTKYVDTPHDGRWLAMPDPIVYADLVDKEDKLASGIEIEGAYVRAGGAAIARGTDAAIIRGIYGTAQTGLKGTILTPFDNNNVVPVNEGSGGNVGLTIKKLNAANEILRANDVDLDEEECWMPITAKQNSNLLAEIETVNKDYGATGAEITNGMVRKLFGFNFAHIELGNPRLKDAAALTVDGNNYRKVPFYTKTGIYAAMWEELFSSIDQLPTKHFSAQVYARRQVASTRSEEGKVGYVLCNEA
ncbi:phage capsid protein [Sphingopyxis granuli]|uniref:phage capsid protein n=1 Tax=Sphingopyxis granuli TaxID=267128 RepID=UPI001BAEBFD5|nr:phage capsid protein [Sphingopyxis granuli]QUM73341.1 hypothetical protein ICN83_05495 [Sphingopyxis granuli]